MKKFSRDYSRSSSKIYSRYSFKDCSMTYFWISRVFFLVLLKNVITVGVIFSKIPSKNSFLKKLPQWFLEEFFHDFGFRKFQQESFSLNSFEKFHQIFQGIAAGVLSNYSRTSSNASGILVQEPFHHFFRELLQRIITAIFRSSSRDSLKALCSFWKNCWKESPEAFFKES